METLKDYLTALVAGEDATATVVFDEVSSVVNSEGETDSETNDVEDYVVLKVLDDGVAAVYEGVVAATTEKRSFLIDLSAQDGHYTGLQLKVDGVQVLNNGTNFGSVTLTNNQIIDKAALLTSLATTRATDLGFTLDVIKGGNYTLPAVTFLSSISSVSNGEYFTNTAANNTTSQTSFLTTYDEFTITIGGKSARASIAGSYTTVAARLADALISAWGAKWATGSASANMSFWTTASGQTASNAIIESLSLKSSNSGSRAKDDTIAITWSTKATSDQVSTVTSGARTESVIDWTYAGDVQTVSTPDLILSITEVTDGVISSGNATLISSVATAMHEIWTSLNVGAGTDTDTTNTIYPTDGRGDAVNNETANDGILVSAAEAATNISRIGWLAD